MTKRIMSLIMALVMVLSCFPAVSLPTNAAEVETQKTATAQLQSTEPASAPETTISAPATRALVISDTTPTGFKYTISNNEASITGYTGSAKALSIPATIIGYPVTQIAGSSFDNYTALTSIVIPDSVKIIDEYAFYGCSALTEIVIPDSVTKLGSSAFQDCSSLSRVTLGSGLVTISYQAFQNCSSLTGIVIPENVATIGFNAFSNCGSLTEVVISDSVQSIGRGAFSGCGKLERITIPFVGGSRKSASATDQYPFGFLFGTSSYTGASAVKQYYYGSSTSMTTSSTYYIPDSLKSVKVTGGQLPCGAFYNCTNLTEIILSDGVTHIGGTAFNNCTSLKSITIPDSVTGIDGSAFSGCTGLTELVIPDSVIKVGLNAFAGCANLKYQTYEKGYYLGSAKNPYAILVGLVSKDVKSFTMHKDAKIIMGSVFSGCGNLTEVAVSQGVITLGSGAFQNCTSLQNITLPAGLVNMEDYAFYGCTGLSSITIPDSVTRIGNYTFRGCTNLTGISIGSGVTAIGNYAFYNCSRLTELTLPNSIAAIGNYAFYNCSRLTELTLPNSITAIGDHAFYNCSGLKSIVIPGGVTRINSDTFYNCSGLKNVVIPDGVTHIYSNAFYGCTGLTELTIPVTTTHIGGNAFYKCSSLRSITLPVATVQQTTNGDKYTYPFGYFFGTTSYSGAVATNQRYTLLRSTGVVETTGSATYYIPKSLKSVTLMGEAVGNYAFYGCTGLTDIILGDGITRIGDYAFYNCSALTDITIPDKVTELGRYAFSGCSGLTGITLNDGIRRIGDSAFRNCSSLTDISLPDSVTWIGETVFSGCEQLQYSAQDNALYLGNENNPYRFLMGTALQTITSCRIHEDTAVIAPGAFQNCTKLAGIEIPNSVIYIGKGAFSGCGAMKSMVLPFVGSSADDEEYSFGYLFGSSSYTGGTATQQYYSSSYYHTYYIPDKLRSVTVTGGVLPYGAFYNCTNLTSVILGDGVTKIGSYAFCNVSGVTELVVPDSVTVIGEYPFSGCAGLKHITVPYIRGGWSGWETFGYFFGTASYTGGTATQQYYSGSQYSTYYIPGGLTSVTVTRGRIPYGAFYNCSTLTSITLGDGITGIGEYAFYNCSALTSITFGNGITQIEDYAFYKCNSLQFNTYDNARYIGSADNPYYYLIGAVSNTITECKIHEDTVVIMEKAFWYCSSLTSVEIPTSVTRMGSWAFSNCTGLRAVYITDLKAWCEIEFSDAWSNPLQYAEALYLNGQLVKSVKIPEGVRKIGSFSFGNCRALTSVIIPDSVTAVGAGAFKNCSALTAVTIPSSVTAIEAGAFRNCSALTAVTIPDGVTAIEASAFESCSALTAVTIPDGVTAIEAGAFQNCSALTAVTIPGSVVTIGSKAFRGCKMLSEVSAADLKAWCKIEFGDATANPLCYAKSLRLNGSAVTQLHIPEGTKKIGDYAFYDCTTLTGVTVPDTVTRIGSSAFWGCSGLTGITIADGVREIGDMAFYNCSALRDITIPGSVTTIGQNVFSECTGLESVTVPFVGGSEKDAQGNTCTFGYFFGTTEYTGGTATEQYNYASEKYPVYYIPDSLRKVTVTGGMLPKGAFRNCSNLTEIVLPEELAEISESVFRDCTGLVRLAIPDGVTEIGSAAFLGCTGLTDITIPDSVLRITSGAFSGCVGLKSITIPFVGTGRYTTTDGNQYPFGYIFGSTSYTGGVATRQYYNRYDLSTLTYSTYYIPSGLRTVTVTGGTILEYAFDNCSKLTGIHIGEGVTAIENYAFRGCTNLIKLSLPDTLTRIGDNALSDCSKLQYTVCENAKYLGNAENPYAVLTEIIAKDAAICQIHQNTKLIMYKAFQGCSNLQEIVLPSGMRGIGKGAFSGCSALQSMTIPFVGGSRKTATDNEQYPFGYIFGSTSYTGGVATSQQYRWTPNELYWATYYIPQTLKSVTVVGGHLLSGVFNNCKNLTSVTIGKDVTSIHKDAFMNCTAMERVEVAPENPYYCSVNGILYNKDKTEIIWAPENLKMELRINYIYVNGEVAYAPTTVRLKVGQNYQIENPQIAGFAPMNEAVSGTMPAEDLVIDVIYYENVKVTGGSCNEAISWTLYTDGKLVLRGTGTMPDYTEGAAPWAQYADQVLTVHIDSRITSIGSYAFAGCRKLTFVDYGYSVAAIGAYAFSGCTGLTSFKLPASVTAIADGGFFGCTGLKTVVIPDNITVVGENAFRGCTALVQVTVGGAVTEIGSNAFADCGKLTQIYFRGAPATLGSNALGATSGKYVYYYSTVSGWQAQITDSKWNGYVAIPYNAVAQQTFDGTNPYIIKVVDKNGLPLSGAAVVLGEASTSTNAEGMAYFAKPTQPQKLEVTCSGHIPFVDEVFAASATQLMDLVELSDSPSSVQGLRLNRTSIATTVAVVNCASDETVSIAVKGTSPKYTIVRYELHQGSRLIATEKTTQASCTFRVKASAFEEGQTVLVRLYTSDGSMVASALNIDVIKLAQISEKQILGELSRINLTIGLGGLGSYKIPINPQSSGNEKFYTSIKDRTIRIGINLDVGEIFAKNDEQKAKTVLHKMVQDSMENFAKDKSGFEYNLCGYIEIEYLGNGNYYVKTSYVKLGLNAKLAFNAQASFFGVVGVYFRASLSGSASLDLHITHFAPEEGFRVDELNFAMENTLELAGGAYVLFGIGSAEFFGSISVGFQLGIIPEFEMESVYVTGELGVRWSILWGLGSGKETLLSGDIYRWPEKTTYRDLEKRFHAVRQDPASYSFNDRAYLEDRSAWLTGEQGYLQKNIYDRVAPETVTCGDTTMMVWLDDNSQRGDTDYQSLYYSVYRDGSWSAPVAVDDDGTFDCEFDLCTDGERIYVIYTQRKNRSAQSLALSEQNDIAAFVGDVEVCVATFENGSFSRSVRLTDNAACELLPDIHWANDTLTAIWLETNAVDLTGEASGGTVYTAVLTDDGWSAPAQVVADQKSVSQVTTVCLGAKAYTVYITDADGSGETTDDQVLVLRDGNGQAVQLETGVIANAREAVIDGVNGLTWYRGGRIYMLTDPTQKPVALTPENVTVGNDYRVISLADGQTLVLFVMGDEAGHGTDLYSVYANAEGCLTQPVRMTQTEGYITNYCVAYRDDTLVSVYTQTLAELSGEEMETVTHLATAELRFRTDITLDSALYEVTDVQPLTALPVELTVTNSGTQPVDGITVQLYHQEQLLYTTACSLALSSGATATCEATVILPETIAEEGYTLRILPENAMTPVTDATPEDNRAELMLAYADLSVAVEQKIAGGKNYLTLTVSNLGNSATAATLALYAPDQTGKQLATLEIQAIAAGETQQYIVDVNPLTDGQDALITCLVTSQLQDPCVINDTAVIKLLRIQNEVFVTDPEQMIRNPELSVSMAEFDKHAPQNITVTVTAEAERFAAVEDLVKDTDYTFRSGELVLLSSYLNKLDVGTHTLKLLFDLGAEEPTVRSLSIHVTDSAPETLTGSIAISGQVVTGGTVSADISGLTPQTSMVTYTWSVDGETVGTQSSYTVRREDLGKTLKLTVTGDEGYTGSFTAEAVVALQKPAAPAAPMVSKVESTAVTLVKVEGMEYSLDLTTWQQSNIFTALAPNESYTFYARKAATEAAQASEASLGVTVTTPKQTVTAPAAPILAERTYNSITLTAVPGAEYRLEGGAWTQNHVFTDLQPNTTYVFFQRYQETQTTYASQASSAVFATLDRTPIAGKVSITGEPYVGATLGVELTEFTGDEKSILYQWYLDGEAIAGATQSTYTVKEADMGKTLQLRITGTGAYRGELTGQLVICDYIPGDVNANLQVDIEDAIWLLRHIFVPAWYAINQDADMNKDGRINSDDAIYLLQHTLMPDQFPLI